MLNYIGCFLTKTKEINYTDEELNSFAASQETIKYNVNIKDSDWSDLILLGRYDEYKIYKIKIVITMHLIYEADAILQYNHIYEYYGANEEYNETIHSKFSAYEITKTHVVDNFAILLYPEKYDPNVEYSKVKIIKSNSGNLYYQYQLDTDLIQCPKRKFTHKFKCESFIE